MHRIPIAERPNMIEAAAEHELEYIPGKGISGWDESAYYQFTSRQIEEDIQGPAEELEDLCFQVVDRAVKNEEVLERLGIAEHFWDYIAASWMKGEKNLYGRMDFSYDGKKPIKLLEYNADTPTTLYETAIFQWEWLEQIQDLKLISEDCDQLNNVHESIVKILSQLDIDGLAHFACNHDIEDDKGTLDYLEECAREAGLKTCSLAMKDIGLDDEGRFTDLEDRVISTLVKLYPWEWIMAEDFGRHISSNSIKFIEPPWKAILSNKGLLPLLWGMFEGHPNLLPAFFEDDPAAHVFVNAGNYVRKPMLSRQGANIEIIQEGKTLFQTDGPYGNDAHILQGFQPLPNLDGGYPLLGCWLVASKAVGLCIREDKTLITSKDARFVPHVILD
jgi:glutathionylspermidine synthase